MRFYSRPATGSGLRQADVIPVADVNLGSWRLVLERRPMSEGALALAYSLAAPRWDRLLSRIGFEAGYLALLRRHGIRGERVLEAGAGTGAFAAALAALVGPTFAVEGIDISEGMLRRALERWRGLGLETAGRVGNIRALPFPDQTFDLVLAGHVLEHLPDPEGAALELLRVLRPGGVLVAVVTRKSLLGRYIQWRWRTRCFDVEMLRDLFPAEVRVDVVPLPGPKPCGWLSLACLVRRS